MDLAFPRLIDRILQGFQRQDLDDGASGLGRNLDCFAGHGIVAHPCGLLRLEMSLDLQEARQNEEARAAR